MVGIMGNATQQPLDVDSGRPVSAKTGHCRRLGELVNSTEAVRKHGDFLRLAEQSEILRDFLASERSEGSKKRTK
jgi:hypothetical protein